MGGAAKAEAVGEREKVTCREREGGGPGEKKSVSNYSGLVCVCGPGFSVVLRMSTHMELSSHNHWQLTTFDVKCHGSSFTTRTCT